MTGRPLLQSSLNNSQDDNLDVKALSQTISMFVWGLILAKAKTGYAAASNKDAGQVSSQFKSIVVLLVMAGLATFAQIQLEKETTVIANYATDNVVIQSRNLKGIQLPTSDDSEDEVDYRDLLKKAENSWNLNNQGQSKKKLQSSQIPAEVIEKAMKDAIQWFMGIVFVGCLVAYASIFSQYSKALEHHKKLTDLFMDPNVRVASGDKGKEILQKIESV